MYTKVLFENYNYYSNIPICF